MGHVQTSPMVTKRSRVVAFAHERRRLTVHHLRLVRVHGSLMFVTFQIRRAIHILDPPTFSTRRGRKIKAVRLEGSHFAISFAWNWTRHIATFAYDWIKHVGRCLHESDITTIGVPRFLPLPLISWKASSRSKNQSLNVDGRCREERQLHLARIFPMAGCTSACERHCIPDGDIPHMTTLPLAFCSEQFWDCERSASDAALRYRKSRRETEDIASTTIESALLKASLIERSGFSSMPGGRNAGRAAKLPAIRPPARRAAPSID